MTWQQALQEAIRDPMQLCHHLAIDPAIVGLDRRPDFPCRVPLSFMRRMKAGDPSDPLLRQVLSVQDERTEVFGFQHDPLEEKASMPVPGLLHKYASRVLLVVAGSCAVNCRFCFRRHFPYADSIPARKAWSRWWTYIQSDPQINEVILSGGDPLMLDDASLVALCEAIRSISQIKRIRIHTRLPIVIPERLTDAFLKVCVDSNMVLVLHTNHANELDDMDLLDRLKRFRQHGVRVLNQAVLLKGVNDSVATQVALSEACDAVGILPYYLHQLDSVQGTAHFAVDDAVAQAIHQGMQARLPGFLVPRLAREEPGALSKSYI